MRRQDRQVAVWCGLLLGASALHACSGDEREFNREDASTAGTGGAEHSEAGAGAAAGSGSQLPNGGAAGAEDPESTAGASGAPVDVPDVTPPTIVDVSPADGEAGVFADAELKITFSEPMNQAATEGAYQSSSAGITFASVSFQWNAAGTELTIAPEAPLDYAEGTDAADVEARAYAFDLGTAAADEAGNSLNTALEVEFTTLRRITQVLQASLPPLSGGYVEKNDGDGPRTTMWVGCLEANEVYRAFVSFELDALPVGIQAFEKAALRMHQAYVSDTPSPFDVLGDLQVISLDYTDTNGTAFDAMDSPTAQQLGLFGTSSALGYKEVEVGTALASDYSTRDRSQYGIKFSIALNSNGSHDYVRFSDATTETPPLLDATYLLP